MTSDEIFTQIFSHIHVTFNVCVYSNTIIDGEKRDVPLPKLAVAGNRIRHFYFLYEKERISIAFAEGYIHVVHTLLMYGMVIISQEASLTVFLQKNRGSGFQKSTQFSFQSHKCSKLL